MSQNPAGAVEVPLNTFAGLVTFMDPVGLPSGASPDCAEMVFQPSGVATRPCFKRYFATTLGDVTVTYGKSYIDSSGTRWNLFLDSAGNLWAENITAATMPTVLLTTTPGSYAKSCTAFGREYIAISNGLQGTDIPYQITGMPDGTIQIDRVTQDGPGSPPTISNLIIPAVDLSTSTGTITIAVDEIDPRNPDPTSGFFTSINLYTTSSLTGVDVGQYITISGTANYNGYTGPITAIFPGTPRSLIEIAAYIPAGTNCEAVAPAGSCTLLGSPGSAVVATGPLQRLNNIVTATCASDHQLQVGYQVQISNAEASEVGTGITSIVIDNENIPGGIATVTVSLAAGQTNHGLVPGCQISMTGIQPATIGTSISTISRAAQVVTVVMASSTGLSPGAVVVISGVTPSSFNGIWTVLNVSTTTNPGDTFTYAQVDVDASGAGGSTAINWPDNVPQDLYDVVAAPTATTFQVAISYADGAWSTGTAKFGWNGTFLVQSVPSATTFTYEQYGPNATAVAISGAIVATPYGQATPGRHQMQVFFIDRQGGITTPSPPVEFVANGGQFLSVTNIPIGPSSIVARGIAFTGAQGAFFFYIPVTPQVNGQIVGTSTVINDNTTTNVVFDFGDPTLFTGLGISIQGNNLANQVVLDGALGFGYYGSRLFTYGQRNFVDNLLNMGFDGGYLPNASTLPTGWTGGGAGTITTGHYGFGWQTSATPLTQSMYEDYTGTPIATANAPYSFRAWASAAGTITATISSASISFSSAVTLTATGQGFFQGNFSLAMPDSIPSDLILGITGSGIVVDEMYIIYRENPFRQKMFASYFNNPTGMDGVSGVIGPQNDTHLVMDLFMIRDNLYMLTQDPQGRLHETSQGITEPADWDVLAIGSSCGAASAFCCTVSQADDATGTGAPAWASWYSVNGYQIFGGEEPEIISQEIQRPEGANFPGAPPDLTDVNQNALLTIWSFNDTYNKIIYLGVPSGGTSATDAPNRIYALTYTGLESSAAIVGNPPIHKAITGKLIASDLGRKWCPYARPMNGGAMMYKSDGTFQAVFFGGNGKLPGVGVTQLYGQAYTLSQAIYTDDDYGQLAPYYTTFGFPDKESAQQGGLGSGQLLIVAYGNGFITGVGINSIAILYGTLSNVWPIAMGGQTLSSSPIFNLELGGGQATGQRFFFVFSASPNPSGSTPSPSTDVAFAISSFTPAFKLNTRMRVRGASS